MRGTVIMWSGEKGVVTSGGQRYDFDINHWNGTVAPASNMTAELIVTDGKLASLTPVREADFAKEKLTAMTGARSKYAKAIFENVGADVAIGYGLFFIIAIFVSLISGEGPYQIKIMLTDLLSGDMARAALGGVNGKGLSLVLLATATIAVPYLKHKSRRSHSSCRPLHVHGILAALQAAPRPAGSDGGDGRVRPGIGPDGPADGGGQRAVRQLRHRRLALVRNGHLPRIQGRDAFPRARLGRHYFIVGIVNSAPRDPSGQRAVTVLSRV
jgi:hypothetical protein